MVMAMAILTKEKVGHTSHFYPRESLELKGRNFFSVPILNRGDRFLKKKMSPIFGQKDVIE